MSVVVLVMFLATAVAAIGAMAAMAMKKEPFYGAVGLFIICLPCSLLAVLYMALG